MFLIITHRFPELFDYISKRLDHEAFYDEDIFGDNR